MLDKDGDGLFEITQWFDRPPWSLVLELNTKGKNSPEARLYYENGLLRLKEIFDEAGRPGLRESFDKSGKLVKRRKGTRGPTG